MQTLKQKARCEYMKEWYRRNPEKRKEHDTKAYIKFKDRYKANSRKWRKANPVRYKELTQKRYDPKIQRGYQLKYQYGITPEQYNALLEKQNHCCAICKKHKSTFKKILAVEHCHKTGEIRGLACHKCNLAIGFIEQEELLQQVLVYLKKV